MRAWALAKKLSVDKQTQQMQGRHPEKLRIMFKKEGDGFQCDTICDDGYTFTFFFCHEPPPKKYVDEGLSALHAQVMSMFDLLEDKNHTCGVDNLYISAKFCRDAYTHPNRILLYRVARRSGRDVPECVLQDKKATNVE